MNKFKANLLKISIAVLGVICLALPFCFANNETANAEASTLSTLFNGDGTESNPYKIASGANMRDFAVYVNNGNSTSGVYFELTSDINLSNYPNWTPIGSSGSSYFAGIFNGNGHTISDITITATSQYVGLFGYVGSSATLTNFEMADVDIYGLVSSTFYVGSVLGYCASGTVEISKVIVSSGQINVSSSNNSTLCIGGIVGFSINPNLVIKQSWTNVQIAGTTANIYKGSILGGNTGFVIDCYSLQNINIVSSNYTIGSNNLLVKYSYFYNSANQSFTYYTDMSSNYGTYTKYIVTQVYDYLKTKSRNWFLSGEQLLLKNVGNVYTLTEASITVVPRYFDISTSSWQTISTAPETLLTLNSTISSSLVENNNANTSTEYLPAFTTAYFNFDNGSNNVPITTSSFTCTTAYLEYAEAGYTLYINYINAKMINVDSEEYWFLISSGSLFERTNETTFTAITTSNLPTETNKYFLGFSTESTSVVGEWNGTGWYHGELFVEAVRNGLGQTPIDYAISSIDFSDLKDEDLSGYSIANPFALFSVWGNDNIRANISVYKFVNDTYTKISNYHISCETATTTAEYISIEKSQAYTFAIKNSSNITLDTTKVGYQIEWYVGTIVDSTKTPPTGSGYGSFSEANLATTEFSNATIETNILVILTPRTDIGIDILTNEFEGSENIAIKLNNIAFALQTLTYGEVYTIKIDNIPSGYYLKSATAQSGITTTFDIDSKTATITFTADFNADIIITINIEESIFNNIYFYLVVAMAIATIIIALSVVVTSKTKIAKK